jgi:hypothetical protein
LLAIAAVGTLLCSFATDVPARQGANAILVVISDIQGHHVKSKIQLAPLITATLYTGVDVPRPRESPLLIIESYEGASEGLGGYGPPDSIYVSGKEALQKLARLLADEQLDA